MPLGNVIGGVSIFMLRILFFFLFVPLTTFAQFSYSIDQSIPVEINGQSLAFPWAGGLNSAQLSTMDFDGDGKVDLVVFDRAANKILPYRNNGSNQYEYTPDYEALFPEAVNAWMLLRDFNCDGKKDLFTSDPFGIIAFVNTTKPGEQLSWRPFNPGFPLLTKGFNGNINLKINDVDIPAIDDVDNDGDLDILSMRFVGIGTVEWHKNMSIENTGVCDSLQLERVTQMYGGVTECTCGLFAFEGDECPNSGRIEHVGGKSLLNIDIDNDGDRDLLYSEETCASLYLLENVGDKDNPNFVNRTNFPLSSPASFRLFPAPYFEDVDFDGLSDLVVSPNLYARTADEVIVKNSLWLYKNTGTAQQPNFTLTKSNFLQENMIDLGDYSVPALMDTDNDGDEDMFVGFYGNDDFRGSMWYFENTGTPTQPKFELVNDDFGGLSFTVVYNVKPQAVDMNGDGNTDLAFTATSAQDGFTTVLYYVPNKSSTGFDPDYANFKATSVDFLGQAENAFVTDVTKDGIPDVLIGKTSGALQLWVNNANDGTFSQLTMTNGTYLGLGSSTSRQNPAIAVGDLDGDGVEDLVMADQRGNISFYGDYRNYDPATSQPISNVVYNDITKEYGAVNLGGRIHVAVSNLFNESKPSIVVGNTLGGLLILRNDGGITLPEEPVVGVGENPLVRGNDLKIHSDRNTRVQIFSILGQKMSEQVFIPANQTFPLALKELAAGMYVARFTFPGRHISIKFIII